MNRFYPDHLWHHLRTDPGRAAETKVFDELRRQFAEAGASGWRVFYSVAWLGRPSPHDPPCDGEADFVIAHPDHGALVIEVKGGAIRYEPGDRTWISRDRSGVDHPIDPFAQALRSQKALVRKIREQRGWSDRFVTIGRAVCFPYAAFGRGAFPPDVPAELVIDRAGMLDLPGSLHRALDFWYRDETRDLKHRRLLAGELERLLGTAVTFTDPLGLVFAEEAREIDRLTEDQYRKLSLLGRRRKAAIGGCAGSGKTWLARKKALQLAGEGFRTLLTCFNRPLADHLAEVTPPHENLTICSFHSLYDRVMTRDLGRSDDRPPVSDTKSYFESIYPDDLTRLFGRHPELRFDAILVDEGQDFRELWWLALAEALRSPDSLLFVFYDDNQRLYGGEHGLPGGLDVFPLVENVRNTRAIHTAAAPHYSGGDVFPIGPAGRRVDWVPYTDAAEMNRQLGETLFRLLVSERVPPSDVVVLTPKSVAKSSLPSLSLKGGIRLTERPERESDVRVSSIHRFKGLEAAVVVVAELDGELTPDPRARAGLCYVAFSRPRSHLVVLGQPGVLKELRDSGRS